jgi:regulator of cell morphogenesis and NO signaling
MRRTTRYTCITRILEEGMHAEATTRFADRSVGEVVTEDYRRGAVFKRFGIDFCCGGGIKVSTACERKGVQYEELERELLAADRSAARAGEADPASWELDFLADYIVNVHHRYVRQSLPVLIAFSEKVAKVHGPLHPNLVRVATLVSALAEDMERHMLDEETLLFPHVRDAVRSGRDEGSGAGASPPRTGASPIAEIPIPDMEDDHERAGAVMREVRELTGGFEPPEGACNTWRAMYAKLEEFEEDLHRHVHLENNILFPATARLLGGA